MAGLRAHPCIHIPPPPTHTHIYAHRCDTLWRLSTQLLEMLLDVKRLEDLDETLLDAKRREQGLLDEAEAASTARGEITKVGPSR